MSMQEFPANSTILDLMERASQGSFRWTSYGFPVKEELRPRLNHEPVSYPTCKIKMGDVVELTPVILDKSYKEEIQWMYDGGLTVSTLGQAASNMVVWRS
ncbi:hypothetical protein HYC85_021000 [Camellia sinensis]|uniref:Uncharacterized protein n=1 Tax=Camellia sinensis TaxID=4442 RepID=A0A7J7GGD7_CAMSI|nr:hypothetical protein HYC85_021000 [Camellia sinensis]